MLNMRELWTDARLDDFASNVDRRFDDLDTAVRDLRGEMHGLRGEMHDNFARVEGRIDKLYHGILWLGGGALVTFVVGFAGLIVTQL